MALKESEREDEFYTKMMARVYVKRGAARNWLSLFEEATEDLEKAVQCQGVFSEQELKELGRDIRRIQNR